MVQVMIRLQNHGRKNHRYWWIVVQPKNKHFQGRILEKVGVWAPRKTKTVDRAISVNRYKLKYWLSVGATPTDGAHRLLYFAGLLPKKPVPFGSKYLYEQEKKPYTMQFFHKHRWGLENTTAANSHYYNKLKEMESIIKSKLQADNEVINEIVRPRDVNFKDSKTEYNTDMNTDDINSDDFEFYSRKRNFDIVSKKMNKYFETQYKLYRGNDYKYNNYLRKLEKLSKFGSLDSEGFKEYVDCVQKLKDSKNTALENIATHFLNELLSKESMKKEISEVLKLAKEYMDKAATDNSAILQAQEEEKETEQILEEDKKFFNVFLSSVQKDKSSIIDTLSQSFKSAVRGMFKLSPDETFTDKEFQDVKNLRMAKILLKLRVAMLNKEREELSQLEDEEESQSKSISTKKSKTSLNNSDHGMNFSSIVDNLKSSGFGEVPIFDNELIDEIIERNSQCSNYDDLLFHNINNYLLNTETFKKFQPVLFHPEFYGYSNIEGGDPKVDKKSKKIYKTSDEQKSVLENPNIYLLNNEVLDELITSLLQKLKKKYEVNDIYRDEEKDLASFEKDEVEKLKRRNEMEERARNLKNKYGDIDLLYEKLEGEGDKYRDVYEFRRQFGKEIEEKFDVKFKRDFRIVKPELKMRRYYTPEEIEETKAKEEKYQQIEEKVRNEIEALRLGLPRPESKPEENEEDKKLEDQIRQDLMFETFGNENPKLNFIPLPDENRPFLDFNPYINILRRRHKKDAKTPYQDEILKLNKEHLRKNIILAHSIQQTRAIPMDRQREMAKRFIDYFGKYNDCMYPDGFRHLENYEIYCSVYPERTIADYQSELNAFCDFDTFVEVCYGSINHFKKIALMGLEFPELFDRTEYLSLYIKSKNSEFITRILKDFYKRYIVEFEKRNMKFKLIDALEQGSAYNMADTLIPEIKDILQKESFENFLGVSHVFNKFTFRTFPKFQDKYQDLNLNRLSPFMPINPLKAHKANPTFNAPVQIKYPRTKLGHSKRVRIYKGYCTMERNWLH